MVWVDVAVLLIVGVSAAISLWRGFVREFFSLLSWIAAFWVALLFTKDVEGLFAAWVSVPSVRLVLGFLALFVVTLLLGAMINHFACLAVEKTGLTGTDRMLGVFFGVGRGIAIVSILALLAGLTAIPRDPWWHDSMFMPYFERIAVWATGFLPADIAGHFSYD